MRNFKSILLGSAALVALVCACDQPTQESALTLSGINPADYDANVAVAYVDGKFVEDTANAQPVKLYTLTNANGMEVCITNFGARIVSIMVPDKDGKFVDVVCGFDKVENYFPWNYETDYGCSVGRYANRINNGTYTSPDGTEVVLDKNNNGVASLHGGYTGWQYQVYEVEEEADNLLSLRRISPDGDNKFPGYIDATVKFELTDNNEIVINYDAVSDAPAVINMTNHSYFNLSGDLNNTIDDAILYINADNYTPADDNLIPTGEIKSVAGTVFDFRTPKAIGTDFASGDPELESVGGGYDHNWCLNTKGDKSKAAVKLYDPRSGIVLQVYTNEPGIQVYTGNFQDGSCTGKKGIVYNKQCAVCLETQKYPDSPNKYQMEGWEDSNCWLNPGETYESYCKFAFSVQK